MTYYNENDMKLKINAEKKLAKMSIKLKPLAIELFKPLDGLPVYLSDGETMRANFRKMADDFKIQARDLVGDTHYMTVSAKHNSISVRFSIWMTGQGDARGYFEDWFYIGNVGFMSGLFGYDEYNQLSDVDGENRVLKTTYRQLMSKKEKIKKLQEQIDDIQSSVAVEFKELLK